MERKLDGNYTRMLQAVLNKSKRQYPPKQKLYGHLPPIMKTIQIRQTRHAGYCWRSKDKLISNVLQWTSSRGQAKVGSLARTCLQQLCANTGCKLEDLLGVMDDRDGWQERVREIRASSTTWWYIYIYYIYVYVYIYIYIYIYIHIHISMNIYIYIYIYIYIQTYISPSLSLSIYIYMCVCVCVCVCEWEEMS